MLCVSLYKGQQGLSTDASEIQVVIVQAPFIRRVQVACQTSLPVCRSKNVSREAEQGMSNLMRERLSAEVSRIEEDALYSSKGHFEAAALWSDIHLWLGIPTALLAAAGGISALSEKALAAGIIGGAVAALTAVATFLNPSGKSNTHHLAGTRFSALKNQARIVREIDLLAVDAEVMGLVTLVKELATRRDELNEASPQPARWAFRRARKAIEAGEADYRVDLTRPTGSRDSAT